MYAVYALLTYKNNTYCGVSAIDKTLDIELLLCIKARIELLLNIFISKYVLLVGHVYKTVVAVAVMYSRNIPMAEKRIVCFQSRKKVKICRF